MVSWFGFRGTAMSEIVLCSSLNFFNVRHSSSTFSFSASYLQWPIVHSHFFVGESASRTSFVLYVVSFSSTSSTQIVHFRMSFTETLSSLSFYHFDFIIYLIYHEINFCTFIHIFFIFNFYSTLLHTLFPTVLLLMFFHMWKFFKYSQKNCKKFINKNYN